MKGLIFLVLLALVVVHAIGLQNCTRPDTQAELANVAKDQLAADEEFADAKAGVERYDITLSGTVPNQAAKNRAETSVRDAIPAGRGRVRNELTVEPWPEAHFTAIHDGAKLTLSGLAANDEIRDALTGAAAAIPGVESVEADELTVATKLRDAGWSAALPGFLPGFFRDCEGGQIEANGDAVTLRGTFFSTQQRDSALQVARELVSAPDRITDETKLAQMKPPQFEIARENGRFTVSGVLPDTENGRALRNAMLDTDPDAEVELRRDVTDAPWLENVAEASQDFFAQITADGSLSAGEAGLGLEGVAKSERARDAALASVSGGLWEGVSVENGLKLPDPKDMDLTLRVMGDEVAAVGQVGTDEDRAALLAALRRAAPGKKITDALEVVPGVKLPNWWLKFPNIFGAFQADAEDAEMSVDGEKITFSGEMATAGGEDGLLAKLGEISGLSSPEMKLKWPEFRLPKFSLKRGDDGKAILTGEVANEELHGQILGAIRETDPNVDATGFTVGRNLKTPDWLANFGNWWPKLRGASPDATFDSADGKLTVDGEFADPAKTRELAGIFGGFEGFDFTLPNMPTMPAMPKVGKLRWPKFSLKRGDGGKLVLNGEAPNAEAHQKVVDSVKATDPEADVSGFKIGPPDLAMPDWLTKFPDWWPKLKTKAPKAEFEAGDGEIAVTGEGAETAAKDLFASIQGFEMPKFSLPKSNMPTMPKVGKLRWPKFSLKRGDGGKLVLNGEAPNAEAHQKVIDSVKATDPEADVSGFKIGPPDLAMPDWLTKFPDWWPKLKTKAPKAEFEAGDAGEIAVTGEGAETAAKDLFASIQGFEMPKFRLPKPNMPTMPKVGKLRWPKFSLKRGDGGKLVLNGEAPNAEAHQKVVDSVKATDPEADVSGFKIGPPNLAMPDWLTKFPDWWPKLKTKAPEAEFEAGDGEIAVTGEGAETAAKDLFASIQGFEMPKFSLPKPNMPTMPNVEMLRWPKFSLKRGDGGKLVLNGEAPNAEVHQKVIDSVKATDPEADVSGFKIGLPDLAMPDWLTKFPAWWPKLKEKSPDAEFEAGDGEIAVTGEGAETAAKDLFASIQGFEMPKFGLPKPNMPTMPKVGKLRWPKFSLKRGDGRKLVLNGEAPNADVHQKVVDSVKATDPEADVSGFKIGPPDLAMPDWLTKFPDWWPKLKTRVPNVSFDIADGEMTLEGEAKDAASAEQVAGLFGDFDGFTLTKPKLTMPKLRWPWLRIQGNKTRLKVEGEVATGREKDQLIAGLSKGPAKIDAAGLKTTPDVRPAPWAPKAGQVAADLAAAAKGGAKLEIEEGDVRVAATVDKGEDRAKFAESLKVAFGEDAEIENKLDVATTVAAKPMEAVEAPEIEVVLPQESVYFNKNDSYLHPGAERDKLMELVDKVDKLKRDDLTILIVGRADSRGNADYNAWLSQRRANNVLAYLNSLGIKGKVLNVKGLGEAESAPEDAGEGAWQKDRRVDIMIGREK